MNKTIWICWFQGWDKCPPLSRYCLDSWKHYNPDWEVIELDDSNYRDYVDIDSILPGVATNKTAFSDILRMFILKEYGGVWADATLFCNKPLDEWITGETEFFVFSRPDIKLASWFIYAQKDEYVITQWYNKVIAYWKERSSGKDRLNNLYTWVHRLFAESYEEDPKFAEIIDRMERIDCYPHPHNRGNGPHMFTPYHKYLGQALTPNIKERIDSKIDPCYKLTNKNGFSLEGTNLEYLFNSIYTMKKTHYVYEDGTQFLSYHDTHGYYFPFIDQRMDHMSKNGPFDQWLTKKYMCEQVAVQEGDTVIDCGSFVGAFSLASAIAGAEDVYAIEPSSRNFHCLNKNIEHFGAEEVIHPVNIGLGDKEATLRLNLSSMSCEDSFLKCDEGATGEYEEVQVLTLEKFISEKGLDESKLYVKIEAEGFELEIVKGIGEKRPRAIVVDVTPERNGLSPREDIKALVVERGYKTIDTDRCLFAYL